MRTMRALALGGRLLYLHAPPTPTKPRGAFADTGSKGLVHRCRRRGRLARRAGYWRHGVRGNQRLPSSTAMSASRLFADANGIQALTLLYELLRDQGAAVCAGRDLSTASPALLRAAEATRLAADWLRRAEPRAAEAGAAPFLQVVGIDCRLAMQPRARSRQRTARRALGRRGVSRPGATAPAFPTPRHSRPRPRHWSGPNRSLAFRAPAVRRSPTPCAASPLIAGRLAFRRPRPCRMPDRAGPDRRLSGGAAAETGTAAAAAGRQRAGQQPGHRDFNGSGYTWREGSWNKREGRNEWMDGLLEP